MAKQRPTRIVSDASREEIGQSQDATRDAVTLRPATRSLRDVLAERGPLTGPISDAGTRALLAVRGERPHDEHGH